MPFWMIITELFSTVKTAFVCLFTPSSNQTKELNDIEINEFIQNLIHERHERNNESSRNPFAKWNNESSRNPFAMMNYNNESYKTFFKILSNSFIVIEAIEKIPELSLRKDPKLSMSHIPTLIGDKFEKDWASWAKEVRDLRTSNQSPLEISQTKHKLAEKGLLLTDSTDVIVDWLGGNPEISISENEKFSDACTSLKDRLLTLMSSQEVLLKEMTPTRSTGWVNKEVIENDLSDRGERVVDHIEGLTRLIREEHKRLSRISRISNTIHNNDWQSYRVSRHTTRRTAGNMIKRRNQR